MATPVVRLEPQVKEAESAAPATASASAPAATTTTPSRAEINRANAQHSTGPKSAAGKAISSRNAATHGLTSSRVFLRNDEERAAFAVFESALESEILPEPESVLEKYHFDRLVAALWNIDRCDRVQSELMSGSAIDPLLDPAHSKTMHNIELYRRRNERSYLMAAKQIRELQAETLFRNLALGTEATVPANISIGILTPMKDVRENYADDECNLNRRQAAEIHRNGETEEQGKARIAIMEQREAREAREAEIVAAIERGEDPQKVFEQSNPDEFLDQFPELDVDRDGKLIVWNSPGESAVDWFARQMQKAA